MQTRTCVDGNPEKRKEEDTQQIVSCTDAGTALPECPKILGSWINNAACVSTTADAYGQCGPGIQMQRRTCKDGTVDKCTDDDRTQNISCSDAGTSLPSCDGKI